MNPKKFRLISLFILFALTAIACQTFSGIGQSIKNTQATAASVVTDVQSFATEGSKLVDTAQAYVTENPGIVDTAKAVITQAPNILKTGEAYATDNPGIVQTAQSIITQAPELIGTVEAFATDNPEVAETVKAIATQGLVPGSKPDDIPLYPEDQMTNFFSTQDMVSYSTATSFKDVVDFYKREMLTNGWTSESAGNIETDSTVVLNYQKDSRKAIVTISTNPADNQTLVLVVIHS